MSSAGRSAPGPAASPARSGLPIVIAASVIGLALTAGCSDTCAPPGAGKCVGNTTYRCTPSSHESPYSSHTWTAVEDCGDRICKSSAYGAVCSLSQDPYPPCAASSTSTYDALCSGSVQIQCGLGYLTHLGEDCGDPALCFSAYCSGIGSSHPVCGPLDEPNQYVRTACYMNRVLFCREGRVWDMIDCGAQQCGAGPAPAPGATWCSPLGKCVPYAPEPLFACQ